MHDPSTTPAATAPDQPKAPALPDLPALPNLPALPPLRRALPGWVYLVGAGPGSADLLTLRGWALLHSATAVVVDALVDPQLFADCPARIIDAGKRAGDHGMTQAAIEALLVELAQAGEAVVRLKGGDPFVLGRGSEEVQTLALAGVPCEVVPGISSAIAAPQLAGMAVTHRGLADAFCVVSGHSRDGQACASLPAYQPQTTVVVLMGVASRQQWVPRLSALGYPAELPMAWITWAGREEQQVLRTTVARCLQDCDAAQLHSPSVAVIGAVAQLGLAPAVAEAT